MITSYRHARNPHHRCDCRPDPLTRVACLLAALLLPTHAAAGDDSLRLSLDAARFTPNAERQAEAAEAPAPPARYGAAGTQYVLITGTYASDFQDSNDVALGGGYSRFLADDVEWLLELNGWYHSQEGGDAASLSPVTGFRWHYYNNGRTSLFLNAGIGLLFASDNVPDMGSGFNFTPQIGAGVTHRLTDAGTRLVAGVRWHHISNARINGEDRNPSRDGAALYLQIAVPM